MKITAKKQAPAVVKTPALVLFLFEDDPADLKNRPELTEFLGQITPRLSGGDFKAKHLNTLTLFQSSDLPAERIILVGLGKTADYSQARLRQATIKAVQAAASMKLSAAAVVLPPLGGKVDQAEEMLEAVALGAALGDYRFFRIQNQRPGRYHRPEDSDLDRPREIFPGQGPRSLADGRGHGQGRHLCPRCDQPAGQYHPPRVPGRGRQGTGRQTRCKNQGAGH